MSFDSSVTIENDDKKIIYDKHKLVKYKQFKTNISALFVI